MAAQVTFRAVPLSHPAKTSALRGARPLKDTSPSRVDKSQWDGFAPSRVSG